METEVFEYKVEKPVEKISFLKTLTGLCIEPGKTTTRLLNFETPPHIMLSFLFVMLSIFGPIVLYYTKFPNPKITEINIASLYLIFIITFFFFVISEFFTLRCFGVVASFAQVIATAVYCLVPVAFIILGFYVYNIIKTDSLSVLPYILGTQGMSSKDQVFKILLVCLYGCVGMASIVLYYSVKLIGYMHPVTASFTVALSILPLLISVLVAFVINQSFFPNIPFVLLKYPQFKTVMMMMGIQT